MRINAISSFSNGYYGQSKITHVYFLKDSAITNINISAFSYCRELLMIDLPSTIREIGDSAFTGCTKLTSVNLNDNITKIDNSAFSGCSDLELTTLPANLTYLGSSAFQSSGPGIKLTTLPGGIEVLYSWTFGSCENVKITNFGSSSNTSKLKEIGANCFNSAGTGSIGSPVTEIVIDASVNVIGNDAFAGYGGTALANAYFAYDPLEVTQEKPKGYYGSTPVEMGLNENVNIGIIERG